MNQSLQTLVNEAIGRFRQAKTLSELDGAKAAYLGKKGKISELFGLLKSMSSEEKKDFGLELNSAKGVINSGLKDAKERIEFTQIQKKLNAQSIDVTLPGRGHDKGAIHPLTQSRREIEKIFSLMGFEIASGPEIENDWFNFTALNNPKDHPARSMQDTFYLEDLDNNGDNYLLRTHTSPVQVRFASCNKPPFRVISPGKTYRVDSDATHSPMFHQIEGLWLDRNVTFRDLKGLYIDFLKVYFDNTEINVRFRPSYFPFTEPSAEVDLMFSKGQLSGKWLEVAGAGMVHPKVISNFKLDPNEFRGFAFGMGLERLTMLKYGIGDLRLFFENDLRFLEQFKC